MLITPTIALMLLQVVLNFSEEEKALEVLSIFTESKKLLRNDIMNTSLTNEIPKQCQHLASIDHQYYCLYLHEKKQWSTALPYVKSEPSSCRFLVEKYEYSEWNKIDVLTRKNISECVDTELKTIAYGKKENVRLPHDFLTSEWRVVFMAQQLLE